MYCSIHLHHHLMGVLSIINFRSFDSPVLLEKGANESVCCVIYSGFATAVSNSCVSSPETMNLIEKLTADVIDFSFSPEEAHTPVTNILPDDFHLHFELHINLPHAQQRNIAFL